MFYADIYRGNGYRPRWAVLHTSTGVWYFPRRYGRKAAEDYARKLNASKD